MYAEERMYPMFTGFPLQVADAIMIVLLVAVLMRMK
jgi:hypothetical protein